MKKLLGSCLILGAIGAFVLGTYVIRGPDHFGIIIGMLLYISGIDMISTLFGKPLIKAGPLARSMYPNMPEGE